MFEKKKYLFLVNITLFILLIFSFYGKYKNNNVKSTKSKSVENSEIYLTINDSKINGKIYLKNNSFSGLYLKEYRKTDNKDWLISEKSHLKTNWHSKDMNVPSETNWTHNVDNLSTKKPLILTWKNKEGSIFVQSMQIVSDYIIRVEYSVFNANDKPVQVAVDLSSKLDGKTAIYHSNNKTVHTSKSFTNKMSSWFGIENTYFGLFILPEQNKVNYNLQSSNLKMEFSQKTINPKESASWNFHVFAGPKDLQLLQKYSEKYDVKDFDNAIDYGILHFITKPLFKILSILTNLFGNFIVALFFLTLLIKLVTLPFSYKSHVSMIKMQNLQPQIERIKEMYKDNNIVAQQEILKLYKQESVNPLGGCLPLVFQLPLLVPLYTIVSINVAAKTTNFLWMKDLSLPDSMSLSNLFNLLPFNVLPFKITILSILFALTMILQQWQTIKMQKDKTALFLPLVVMVFLSNTSAAFMLYMIWSNTLSWIQSLMFSRMVKQ